MRDTVARTSTRRSTAVVFGALVLAVGIATALYTVVAVYRLHVVLPIWDEWLTVVDIQRLRAGTYGLADLLRQHHEHRLLVPRLFFFVDDLLFGMSDRFNIAVMFAFQAANAAILIRLAARRIADRALRLAIAGFVLLALFSLRQETNLTLGFQLQFTGIFTFAMLAAMAYVDALDRLGTFGGRPRPGAGPRFALAGLLCTVATYTMANGMLAGFTLLALALAVGAPWRVSLATALLSAALAALYFHGYVKASLNLSLADALADPLAYPRFLAALLGSLAGEDLRLTQLLGAAGLLAFAAAAFKVATLRPREPSDAVLLAIMGFAVASSCAATYGRIGVGIMQAYEDRYIETGVLFWCALLLFWIPAIRRVWPRPAAVAGAALLSLAAALIAGPMARAEIEADHDMVAQAAKETAFRDSLLTGLYDEVVARYEIFEKRELVGLVDVLRDERLSLFGTPEARDLGRPIDAIGPAAPPSACTGRITATADPATLGPDGVRLRGSAWDTGRDGPVRRILVVGGDGRVVGFGSRDKPGTRARTWTGYAKAAPGATVAVHAVLDDGRLCDLGPAVVAGP